MRILARLYKPSKCGNPSIKFETFPSSEPIIPEYIALSYPSISPFWLNPIQLNREHFPILVLW